MTNLTRICLGLAIGSAGSVVFYLLHLPLPWMLGALFTTMFASLAGVPLRAPDRARPVVVAVIGVLLGARFSPEVMGHLSLWAGTLSLLVVYLLLVGLVVVPFYHFIGRQSWTTSFFSGMPGGISEMIEFSEHHGADVRAVILAHSLRVVMTIALIAFWFRVVQGETIGRGTGGPILGNLALEEALLLLAAALVGSLFGRLCRLPAPTFLGPMIVSAGLHLAGISESAPPDLLVNVAQVVLGTILGAKFRGVPLRALRPAAVLSLVSTAMTLALAAAFALIMQRYLSIDPEQAVLALAPGGLTEMGLIALAIHADVAFVALHHVVRILLVIVAAPLLFAVLMRGKRG